MAGTDPQKRALILDFDGVIVETEALHFRCWNDAFSELHGRVLDGDHKQIVGLSLDAIFGLWMGEQGGQSTPLTRIQKRCLLERKTERYFEVGATLLEPVAGVIELVRRARQAGWYVTIASRARRQRLLRTLEMLALPVDFDLIMGTEDLVDSQTDCKVHTRTVTPFGVAPRHCVVVEDSASGVREACACNVGAVIGLTTSLDAQTLQAAGAAPVLETLFDVTTFLAPLMADGA